MVENTNFRQDDERAEIVAALLKAVVELLVGRDDVDVKSKDNMGRS